MSGARNAPNRTDLSARVRSLRPEPDGWGWTAKVEVLANLSPDAKHDFLRPAVGDVLDVFSAEELRVTSKPVRLTLELLAGPGGGRVVVKPPPRA